MAEGGFDLAAFKAHLDTIDTSNLVCDPISVDLFSRTSDQDSTRKSGLDSLPKFEIDFLGQPGAGVSPGAARKLLSRGQLLETKPISDVDLVNSLTKPLDPAVEAEALKNLSRQEAERARAVEAERAKIAPPLRSPSRETSAQEALLAHPAEMRKLFDATYKDVSVNHNQHIDMYEINSGLAKTTLPEAERNFLTVLKKGYLQMSVDVKGAVDNDGVSATSLLMIDKAMNRSIKEDPIYKTKALQGLGAGALFGVFASRGAGDGRSRLLSGLTGFVLATAFFELDTLADKSDGYFDATYNKVARDYKAFVNDYERNATH